MNYELIRGFLQMVVSGVIGILVVVAYGIVIYYTAKGEFNDDKVKYPWEKEEKRAAKKAAKRERERKWYECK